MRKIATMVVLSALVLLLPLGVAAQEEREKEAPAAAQGPAQEVLDAWNYVGGKLITMAEDFPEKLYDYKPAPEVRSFAEQLLHVAGSNYLFVDSALGHDMGPEDLSRDDYPTKSDIVRVLRESVEEGAAAIQAARDAGMSQPIKHPFANRMVSQNAFWMAQVEHAGEHYGNLVVYYRLNDIVPPASRGN